MTTVQSITPAKLRPPHPTPDALLRGRLIDRITAGTGGPLTLLSAPAGSGKTELLVTWLRAAALRGPVAWVTVEERDQDPETLWSSVFAALQLSGALPTPADPPSNDSAVRRTQLAALAAQFAAQPATGNAPSVLVLDDFGAITGPAVPNELGFVLHHSAPGLRLVLATRAEPSLPVHRYRLCGELTELRTDDLAFTQAEITELLAGSGDPRSTADIAALHATTQGWVAGVRMAALSPDSADTLGPALAPHGWIDEYLAAEVLADLPVDVGDFMERTSVVDSLCPELAHALTGRSDSGRLLAELVRTNRFVRAGCDGTYRYHPLLRGLLQRRLADRSPASVAEMRGIAARWLSRNRGLRDGLLLAASCRDWSLASTLVVDDYAIAAVLTGTDRPALAELFGPAPAACADAHTAVVLAAIALGDGDLPRCSQRLTLAKQRAATGAQRSDALDLAIAMVELQLGLARADSAAVREAAAAAEAVLREQPGRGADGVADYRATLLVGLGAALLWSGDFDDAATVLRRAGAAADLDGAPQTRIDVLAQRALAELLAGRRRRAQEVAAAAQRLADEMGAAAAQRSPAGAVTLGWLAAEDGDLVPARAYARAASAAMDRLRFDPSAAALLARLQSVLRRSGQPYLCSGAVSAIAPAVAPAWFTARFGVSVVLSSASRRVVDGAALSQRTAVNGTPPAPVRRIGGPVRGLAAVRLASPAGGPGDSMAPGAGGVDPVIIEPLTEREREVLRHLAAAMSTEEVAQAMFVSINTVRTHVRGILRKLSVSRRNQAIRRARQLQLI